MMLSGQGTSRLVPCRCFLLTVPRLEGWQLVLITITVFLSIQVLAVTFPAWTVTDSPLLNSKLCITNKYISCLTHTHTHTHTHTYLYACTQISVHLHTILALEITTVRIKYFLRYALKLVRFCDDGFVYSYLFILHTHTLHRYIHTHTFTYA